MPLVELLRIVIALVGTSAAAYQDARTSFIDEKITYSMIALGAILNLGSLNYSTAPNSIDWGFVASSFGGAAIIFAIGYLLYRRGQLGGGDVLLFTGIHLLLPTRPIEFGLPLLAWAAPQLSIASALAYQRALGVIPLTVSVFAAASFLALVGSALLYAKALYGRRLQPDSMVGAIIAVPSALFAAWIYSMTRDATQPLFFLVLAAPFAFLAAFKKQILEEVIVQKIPIEKFEEEDILVTEMMDKKLVQKYCIGRVLTREEVTKLERVREKEGLTLFPVAKVLPRLGPYVLLGLLCTLLLGDLFAFFLVI